MTALPTVPPTFLQILARGERARRVAGRLARLWRATLVGGEHVPEAGGALLVGNHTLFGMDSSPLAALLVERVGRLPRWLGEKNLWRIPGAWVLLEAIGAIPGEPDRAVHLLQAGELVCVYPGGVDDSFKLSSEAYTLMWGQRAGFARVAMRARVPILPIAATGVDEIIRVERRERTIGRWLLGSARYDLPVPALDLPRRVPLEYHVLPPIDTQGDPANDEDVERVRAATHAALESVLGPYRALHRK